ncbi:MAG: hypothetical protein WC243_01020 [Patescibacteria group bacterium]|jgi:cell division ATPase FtsA
MPFLKLFGKNKPNTPQSFVVVGVDSNDVVCLRVETSDGNVKIVGAEKQGIPNGSVILGNIENPSAVLMALGECLDRLDKIDENLEDAPKDMVFVLSGGNSLGLMTAAKVRRDGTKPLSVKELDLVYKKTTEASLMKMQSELLVQKGNSEIDMELVTSSVLYTRLDDKNVLNPVGMECSTLEMAIFTSFAPKEHLKMLNKLAKSVGFKLIGQGYDVFSLVNTMEKTDLENINYVLIHMGSDFTNVGIIFGGGLITTKVLPVGRDHFAKEISQELGIAYREADEMLSKYSSDSLSESENLMVRNALQDVLKIWLSGVELLFAEFSGIKTFASRIYLAGEGFDVPDIYEVLVTEPWTKSIPFREPPEFSKLPLSEISVISDLSGKATSLEWTMPATLSISFLDR